MIYQVTGREGVFEKHQTETSDNPKHRSHAVKPEGAAVGSHLLSGEEMGTGKGHPPCPRCCLCATTGSSLLSAPVSPAPFTCAFLPPPLLVDIPLASPRPRANVPHSDSRWPPELQAACWCSLLDVEYFRHPTQIGSADFQARRDAVQ